MAILTKPLDSRIIYNRIKSSAKRRGIDFDLSIVDINNLSFPITCPIFGMPLYWHTGKPQENSYSIDRIDSSKGYTIDNIQVISLKANVAKNNLSDKELKLFALYFQQ